VRPPAPRARRLSARCSAKEHAAQRAAHAPPFWAENLRAVIDSRAACAASLGRAACASSRPRRGLSAPLWAGMCRLLGGGNGPARARRSRAVASPPAAGTRVCAAAQESEGGGRWGADHDGGGRSGSGSGRGPGAVVDRRLWSRVERPVSRRLGSPAPCDPPPTFRTRGWG
jgi:hypothetical protein